MKCGRFRLGALAGALSQCGKHHIIMVGIGQTEYFSNKATIAVLAGEENKEGWDFG